MNGTALQAGNDGRLLLTSQGRLLFLQTGRLARAGPVGPPMARCNSVDQRESRLAAPAAAISSPPAPTAGPAPSAPASPTPAPLPNRPERRARSVARAQADTTLLISRAVQEEAERAGGDEEAALKALIKRAIPDVMHLFNETRATARYDYTAYPALPDILKKPSKNDPDQIWEARPKFHHPGYSLRAPVNCEKCPRVSTMKFVFSSQTTHAAFSSVNIGLMSQPSAV